MLAKTIAQSTGTAFLAGALLLTGCAGGPLSTREKGAGIGALGGAAAGGLVGSAVGHPGAGAAIGGVLFAGSLSERDYTPEPGIFAGIVVALLGFAAARVFLGGAMERLSARRARGARRAAQRAE